MSLVFLCLLMVSTWAKADWELSVVVGDGVEALDGDGRAVLSCRLGLMSKAPVMVTDWAADRLLVADSLTSNSTLYSVALGSGSHCNPPSPLLTGVNGSMMGAAYDPVEGAVYWTTGWKGAIFRSDVGASSGSGPRVLHSLPEQVPHGIALDSCRRTLYWSNCNMSRPSIEMSKLDGTGRVVLVESNLFQPVAVTLATGDDYLYWADEGPGYTFTLSRISLRSHALSTEREILVKSSYQQPISLAVVPGERIYWMDRAGRALWALSLASLNEDPPLKTLSQRVTSLQSEEAIPRKPVLVKQYSRDSSPSGLAVRQRLSEFNPYVCSDMMDLLKEVAKSSEAEKRNLCGVEYCLHNGVCSTDKGLPVCNCTEGFMGDRCQYESTLCPVFCKETSSAHPPPLSHLYVLCRCGKESRQEMQLSMTVYWWRLATICLGATCGLLVLVTVALAYRTHILSKRPKLRRRIRVEKKDIKKQGSRGREAVGSPCEIGDIENCCNMNICETPCYEPEFRREATGARAGPEHRSLISDMEVPEPTEPPL